VAATRPTNARRPLDGDASAALLGRRSQTDHSDGSGGLAGERWPGQLRIDGHAAPKRRRRSRSLTGRYSVRLTTSSQLRALLRRIPADRVRLVKQCKHAGVAELEPSPP
jgi:hypothetical protein